MQQTTDVTQREILPEGYAPKLDFFQTEKGIKLIKDTFERILAEKLSLTRVSAPRFLIVGTGLQDDLAGTQVPVSFTAKFTPKPIEVVHSLAKWKRFALGKYKFKVGTGLYTDMDAVRKDEDVSPIHSIYVDQWDWEKIITKEDRKIEFLKETVKKIYQAILETEELVEKEIPKLKSRLPKKIKFIHTEELEERFPELTPKEREDRIAKEQQAVFIIGIGHPLKSGKPHDLRAADYDDWHLCGDIIIWDPIRKKSLELSSMGIRVDKESLLKQLEHTGLMERKKLEFHKSILEDKIPLTIGGGIGQSRLCMALLQKAHVGEVQSSIWPKEVEEEFSRKEIALL
ncbi:MAG: aspartate--ammonia ligase [Nanoarchaeota archaeon]|nr:aspartate--ammonia ligase [Nanoarchaeota archaeon]MBU1643565.1 aspartate--ammonia ligase [Nanoarchaeota archaeon]MBU1976781.1 aspartate--ammonia ligase [Nanoarchaeota archaeon]